METKAETAEWAQSYEAALSQHLKQGSDASLQRALGLGRQAVALGLETLNVAVLHAQALKQLVSPERSAQAKRHLIGRAESFFAETIVPIEKTHDAALKADARVKQLSETLHRRTVESCASDRQLAKSIVRRQATEAALEKSSKDRTQMLTKSISLQNRLRAQTREILLAQEDSRRKTSIQLQDEIAQTLLAINIKLLAMRVAAKANAKHFAKEIANTQRLVRDSAKKVNRVHA